MNETCVFTIGVCTDNEIYKFTAFTNKAFTNELISDVIREGFSRIGCDYISADSVEDIVVVFASDTFDGILSPEIDAVWPTDFNKKCNCDKCKKGGENYRHGKDDVFKNRR